MNKALPYVIAFFVAVTLFIAWVVLGDQIKAWFSKPTANNPGAPGASPAANTAPALNLQLVLKKGLYNSAEVAELQKKLGQLDADGDFGDKTEARLLAVKGVKEIKLADYDTTVLADAPAPSEEPWYSNLPFGFAIFG